MPAATGFPRVQEILNSAVKDWETRTHTTARLNRHHRNFGWTTKQQLLDSQAFGIRLIQPDVVGVGRGQDANLVIALRAGVAGRPRMPIGGPFLADPIIEEIVGWINDGTPD